MAYEAWVTTSTKWCEKMDAEASMLEKRVYPAEHMPDFPGYQVLARKCTLGIACNLAGIPCRWAYTGLGVDLYEPTM